MGWTLSLYSIVVFGSALVALVVGFAALQERPDPMAWPLAILMFMIAAWAIPDAISFGYSEFGRVLFWKRLTYPGIVFSPVVYLVLALRYGGYEQWLSRRVYALLTAVPVITIVIVWTNPYHSLYWQSISLAQVGGATVLVPEFGIWYWVDIGYLYCVAIAALSILGTVVIRSGLLYRKQATLMFVAGLVPLATNVVMEFGIGDPMVDLTTTALTVTGLTFALALFHFDLLAIQPVARDRLVDELDDGVIVVGPNGQIRDFNPTATRIFEDIAVNQSAAEVLPSDIAPDGGELVVETNGNERQFRTRSTELTDERGQQVGRIVYLNDITDIAAREQRISVLNRVLRHNIRNDLNVAFGRLEMLKEPGSEADREHLRTAKENVQRVIEFADKARHVEQTLQQSETATDVSATTIAEQVVADAREQYDDAVIEYEPPNTPTNGTDVRVVDAELFELALAELVENAVVHTHQDPPEVVVDVDPGPDQIHISVTDNGPGIPDQEQDVLLSRTETPLEHGSGLGLWLVQWTASLSSGKLRFAENNPRGSVVTLGLPSAAE